MILLIYLGNSKIFSQDNAKGNIVCSWREMSMKMNHPGKIGILDLHLQVLYQRQKFSSWPKITTMMITTTMRKKTCSRIFSTLELFLKALANLDSKKIYPNSCDSGRLSSYMLGLMYFLLVSRNLVMKNYQLRQECWWKPPDQTSGLMWKISIPEASTLIIAHEKALRINWPRQKSLNYHEICTFSWTSIDCS